MDADRIRELFAAYGPVSIRRMFGGFGIYAEGRMFALAHEGVIYLKADAATVAAFEREGQGPFTYSAKGTKGGKRSIMSYWRMPERLYDDADELAVWARDALLAAERSAGAKPARVRRAAPKRPASRPPAQRRGRSRR
jgi:DNA transformation protein and related proteins